MVDIPKVMSNLSFYFDCDHEILSFSSALVRLINATALACVGLINTTAVRCQCIFVIFFDITLDQTTYFLLVIQTIYVVVPNLKHFSFQ